MNFDYIRLFLAVTVMLVHAGVMPKTWLFWNSELSVFFFFCISGFLITQSYLYSMSLEDYFKKRVARIYPPIVCVAVIMFIVGLCGHADHQLFLRGVSTLLLFQDLDLLKTPDIYSHGAFWTLVLEFQFYLLLPFIVHGLRKRERMTVMILAILYFTSVYLINSMPEDYRLAFRQSIFCYADFFIAGIALAYYAKKIVETRFFFPILFPFAFMIYCSSAYFGNAIIICYLPFAMMILILAAAKWLGRFGRKAIWGDLSYGIYLYHFPIMTILGKIGLKNEFSIVLFTIIAAFLSWQFLEKKVLVVAHNHPPNSA